ncbi:MAG: GntR family transcriptional repressor for pyruvate dehydrogenase complex [Verrucomicrobiales bacterium]|jgi:GntR family transcriptional repressor for pyruvate dehydrogenase complex
MTDIKGSPAFDPISRETVSSQIRSQLLERIRTGELAPGSQMPSERDLSERFSVARTSVREAMQGLVSLGAVERRGNRAFVVEHLPDVVVEPASNTKRFVAELFETRRVLEVPLFELAAARASDDERERVLILANRFHDALDISAFRILDREFHTTIAASCGNPLLIELYGKVLDQLFRSGEFSELLTAEENQEQVERIVADSSRAHMAIAVAFGTGDSSAVRGAAESHLDSVEHSMIDNLE